MDIDNDKYAGDSAWEEWFEVCAVDRCMTKYPLRRQVESAMYGRLFRYGFTGADAQGDDPVAAQEWLGIE